jgi:hypothetical protein
MSPRSGKEITGKDKEPDESHFASDDDEEEREERTRGGRASDERKGDTEDGEAGKKERLDKEI